MDQDDRLACAAGVIDMQVGVFEQAMMSSHFRDGSTSIPCHRLAPRHPYSDALPTRPRSQNPGAIT
jgi:hypothetical protein